MLLQFLSAYADTETMAAAQTPKLTEFSRGNFDNSHIRLRFTLISPSNDKLLYITAFEEDFEINDSLKMHVIEIFSC
jgi:hypothetical protein